MEKIFYICALLCAMLITKAQQPELLNRTWNIEKVTINNQDYIFPNTEPSVPGNANITATFFSTQVCINTLQSNVSITESHMNLSGISMTLITCPFTDYSLFEDWYFGIFFGSYNAGGFYTHFAYQIENTGQNLKLTLTNPIGDRAVYRSANLSISAHSVKNVIEIFPNPAQNYIQIKTVDSAKNIIVTISDMAGRQVLKETLPECKNSRINISTLMAGTYFATVSDGDKTYIRKVIKK